MAKKARQSNTEPSAAVVKQDVFVKKEIQIKKDPSAVLVKKEIVEVESKEERRRRLQRGYEKTRQSKLTKAGTTRPRIDKVVMKALAKEVAPAMDTPMQDQSSALVTLDVSPAEEAAKAKGSQKKLFRRLHEAVAAWSKAEKQLQAERATTCDLRKKMLVMNRAFQAVAERNKALEKAVSAQGMEVEGDGSFADILGLVKSTTESSTS